MSLRTTALLAALALLGCGPERTADATCQPATLDGTCVGVTRPRICTTRFCTAGVPCIQILHVDRTAAAGGDGSETRPLQLPAQAAGRAAAGDCIALAAGSYPGCALPGGVSLLGAGADITRITTPITVAGGQGSVLRGFALQADSTALVLSDARAARVEQVRIEHSRGVGLLAIGGELVAKHNSVGHTGYRGGFATNLEAQQVRLELAYNHLHHAAGPGLVLHGCSGSLHDNLVDENGERGVHLQRVGPGGLELSDNSITGSQRAGLICIQADPVRVVGGEISRTANRLVLDGPRSASVGDGVQVLDGSRVALQDLLLLDNPRYGVLVDRARASLTDVTIGGSVAAVMARNTAAGDVSLERVTDLGGGSQSP